MPVAIVMCPETDIPAVLHEDCETDLVLRLDRYIEAPSPLREDTARLWLLSLPAPSGWFNSIGAARLNIESWLADCASEHPDGLR